MRITIDGKQCECEKGEFLLAVARRNGFDIPTLCHHDGLPGQGCCRLCIVEVEERGRKKIVVSCVYPVAGECAVYTDSGNVRRQRGMILALLKKRAPDSVEIAALCKKYGAPELRRIKAAPEGKCILCGLCVKACAELGAGAIATVNRGVTKEIASPYHEPPADCVGCASCARVCPTGAIPVTENGKTRLIWNGEFPLAFCGRCGAPLGTVRELAHAAARVGEEPAVLCDSCRRARMADTLAHTYGR